MATRAVTITPATPDDQSAHVAVWAGLLNGDDGAPVKMASSQDRSVQYNGTFGAGGSIQLEGSNDVVANGSVPTNWFLLNTPQGTTGAKTANGIVQIEEATLWVRPRVTAGDGTTTLTASLFMKKVA